MIPGTKSEAAVRVVPLQDTLRPWIARMKARIRPHDAPEDWRPDPMALVFITNARHPHRLGRVRSLSNRISLAQRLAGTKRRGKAQHWARATFATMIEPKVSAEKLKQYLGHDEAFGGATDVYIEATIAAIPPEHRKLIEHLPNPADIEAALGDFKPEPLSKPDPSRQRKPKKDAPKVSERSEAASA